MFANETVWTVQAQVMRVVTCYVDDIRKQVPACCFFPTGVAVFLSIESHCYSPNGQADNVQAKAT
jgi:hypothetical protein